VRLLLSGFQNGQPRGGGGAAPSPPVVTFVNFFEFADRHHATSMYTTMASQLAESLDAMRAADGFQSRQGAGGVQSGQASGGGGPDGAAAARLRPRSSVDEVAALWGGSTPSAVAETAKLIRAWASRGRRDVGSTDVWRNWWRDMEVRALQVAYRLPAVSMFQAFGAEFETHAHGHVHSGPNPPCDPTETPPI